jgi:hypothetical protein
LKGVRLGSAPKLLVFRARVQKQINYNI